MNLEVLLSTMNLKNENLNKMNIKSKCTVINQCEKTNYLQYNNFNIYSYNEIGLSNSRNRGLEKVKEDIIILCDDDVVYNDNYEKIVLNEFSKNEDADLIIFNIESPNRKIKQNIKNKRLHFYNILRYSSQRIAFRKRSIEEKNICFNTLFGAGAKYASGEDALFLVSALKSNLKIYASTQNIGVVYHNKSTWFDGYNEKFFFDKGALFTAISYKTRYLLFIQYLIRNKEVLENHNFFDALRLMVKGSNNYIDYCKNM